MPVKALLTPIKSILVECSENKDVNWQHLIFEIKNP